MVWPDADLVSQFSNCFPSSHAAQHKHALQSALAELVQKAKQAWPEVLLSTQDYFAFLARHISSSGEPFEELARRHTSDMYLVAACAQGDRCALETFNRHFLSGDSPSLSRLRFPPEIIDEARQVLRERLWVKSSSHSSKMEDYSGEGNLAAWVRAALIRTALRLTRAPNGRIEVDVSALEEIASPAGPLEVDYLKRTYGPLAQQALADGFSRLQARERNLLRQHYGLGLEIEEIARFYRVHRVTVWRWILHAKDELLGYTRENLLTRFSLGGDELSSLVRLMHSQLESGLRTLIAQSD